MIPQYDLYRNVTRPIYGLAVIAVRNHNLREVEPLTKLASILFNPICIELGHAAPAYDLTENLTLAHEGLWDWSLRSLVSDKTGYEEILDDDPDSRLPSVDVDESRLYEELALSLRDLARTAIDEHVPWQKEIAEAVGLGLKLLHERLGPDNPYVLQLSHPESQP